MRKSPMLFVILAGILLVLLLTRQTYAAGALHVNGTGEPLTWEPTLSVPFNPDQGALGMLDNARATALVSNSFGVWQAVPTTTVDFAHAGALPFDVTASNVSELFGVCNDGLSPIIFDADGSITDLLLGVGAGNRVLGFAGPECYTFVPPVITEGFAVLNGRFIDGLGLAEISLTEFATVFIHEFGHYLNLDHTQINLSEALDGDPANDVGIPTMFPLLANGTEQSSLHLDDRVSVSALYPASHFFPSTGSITGMIFLSDGVTSFQGANVIARNAADPLSDVVSNVSGSRFVPSRPGGPPPASLQGLYEIFGLTPGANYTVEIEQIATRFTGGSSVGPVDPPAILPGPPEFWNGENESNDAAVDDPQSFVTIPVRAGQVVDTVDIVMNRWAAYLFRCAWGLYIDDGGSATGDWNSYLSLSNANDTSRNFEVVHSGQQRRITNTFVLAPNETVSLSCEDLSAPVIMRRRRLLLTSDGP